jgi:hypothetical protein
MKYLKELYISIGKKIQITEVKRQNKKLVKVFYEWILKQANY